MAPPQIQSGSSGYDYPVPEGIVIRCPCGDKELEACVRLQETVWGVGLADTLDEGEFKARLQEGGILLCAFNAAKALIGLVFSYAVRAGSMEIQHSHLLAVDPAFRDRGLGRALKLAQRTAASRRGTDRIVWTFDPLESRNAYLNLNLLGAFSRNYFEDFYGDSGSPLHSGTATDRLLAEWSVLPSDPGVVPRSDPVSCERILEVADYDNQAPVPGNPAEPDGGDFCSIEVPFDFQGLKSRDVDLARRWRRATRRAFQSAFRSGYVVTRMKRETAADPPRVAYLLERNPQLESLADRLDFTVIPFRAKQPL